ncbi:MAG: lipopolysaccharide biosynthesis protein [Firmicutes bacterium]|nr:lipopolysaccharide biosynthesis protein [Bacillota bacterium]
MDKQLDLHGLISIVRRHRNWVYSSFCIAIILAIILNLMPPTYETKVTIRIKPAAKSMIDAGGATWQSEELARQKMYTYAELIKSRSVVEAAIGKLDPDEQASLRYETVIERITVRPLKDTEILNTFVLADSPQKAQNLANALAVAVNEMSLDIARAEGKETRIFIGDRLAEKKRELDEAGKALVDYKKNNRVVAITEQARAFVERQSILKKLDTENQLVLGAAYAKQKTPDIIVDTPVVQLYRNRLAEQEAELAGLSKSLTDEHPRVVNLKASIAENQKRLQTELIRIAIGEVSLGETQKTSLQRITSQEEKELAKLPATETQLARLMLDYSVAESTYTTLAKRYEEARISEIMESANMQVIDMAALPEDPVKPKKVFNLCISAILGLFIGTMITFFVEYFYKTIDTVGDLQHYLAVPVIGVIPRVGSHSPSWTGSRKADGENHG